MRYPFPRILALFVLVLVLTACREEQPATPAVTTDAATAGEAAAPTDAPAPTDEPEPTVAPPPQPTAAPTAVPAACSPDAPIYLAIVWHQHQPVYL